MPRLRRVVARHKVIVQPPAVEEARCFVVASRANLVFCGGVMSRWSGARVNREIEQRSG